MNGEELSIHLGDLPEDLVWEAMECGRHSKRNALPWRRLIACTAALALLIGVLFWDTTASSNVVTAPGILTIRAYAADAVTSEPLKKGVKLPLSFNWNLATNRLPGLPLRLILSEDSYPYMDISFSVSASEGSFYINLPPASYDPTQFDPGKIFSNDGFQPLPNSSDDLQERQYPTSLSVPNGTQIYWQNITETDLFAGEHAYVDIIIWADDHIVGYAVVDIYLADPASLSFGAAILESISFPTINGEFQDISQAYVQREMMKIRE